MPTAVVTPSSFPLSSGEQVGSGYTVTDKTGTSVKLEPSGLVVMSGTLYMASDNGYLVSMDVSSNASMDEAWTITHNYTNDSGFPTADSHDFESITVASSQLMIGVEGRAANSSTNTPQYNPHIYRLDNTGKPTSSWELTDVTLGSAGGMEAMTLVPKEACPPSSSPAYYGGSQYYDGYFFAAYQSKTGYVYVYDLPQGSGTSHTVTSHLKKFELLDANGAQITKEASDMCFADGYLFVLFDGGGSGTDAKDEIHLFSIRADGTGLDHAAATYLPSITGVWTNQTDFEGIAIHGGDMYLAVDQAGTNGEKLVYRYTDYSISKFV